MSQNTNNHFPCLAPRLPGAGGRRTTGAPEAATGTGANDGCRPERRIVHEGAAGLMTTTTTGAQALTPKQTRTVITSKWVVQLLKLIAGGREVRIESASDLPAWRGQKAPDGARFLVTDLYSGTGLAWLTAAEKAQFDLLSENAERRPAGKEVAG